MADENQIQPVPGPRPYRMREAPDFHGREEDVDKVLNLIENYKLSFLMGRSGVGKTSLLRAGVVPELRDLRETQAEDGGPTMPPVLFLRDWHKTGESQEPQTVLLAALRRALEDDSILVDGLPSPEEMTSFSEGIESIMNQLERSDRHHGGRKLIVIFDQFEELLRAGDEMKHAATEAIHDLHMGHRFIGIHLSLRVEHEGDLHKLEAKLDEEIKKTERSHLLEPPSKKVLQSALGQALDESLYPPQVASRHLESSIEEIVSRSVPPDGSTGTLKRDSGGGEKPELLVAQSLAYQFHEWLKTDPALDDLPEEDSTVEEEGEEGVTLFDLFVRSKGWEESGTTELVNLTLVDWIEDSLGLGAERTTPRGIITDRRQPDRLTALIKHMAARTAPYLSSGGFKVKQTEADLMWAALEDHLRPLGLGRSDVRPAGRQRDRPRLSDAAFQDIDEEKLAVDLREVPRSDLKKSLELTFHDMIDGLASDDRNVLRLRQWTEGPNGVELVHDRLGNPFRTWADEYKGGFRDFYAPLTIVRGPYISVTDLDGRKEDLLHIQDGRAERGSLKGVRWWGGVLQPGAEDPNESEEGNNANSARIRNIRFVNCDLRGFVFRNCSLENVIFEDCIMNGSLFQSCRFESVEFRGADTRNSETENEKISAGHSLHYNEISILDSVIKSREDGDHEDDGSLSFRDCVLRQFSLARCRLEGDLLFTGCKLILPQFRKIGSPDQDPSRETAESGKRAAEPRIKSENSNVYMDPWGEYEEGGLEVHSEEGEQTSELPIDELIPDAFEWYIPDRIERLQS